MNQLNVRFQQQQSFIILALEFLLTANSGRSSSFDNGFLKLTRWPKTDTNAMIPE